MAGMYYWVGQDGNVWLKSADGSVSNAGKALSASPGSFSIQTADGPTPIEATQIADPNARTSAPAGGTPNAPLNEAAVSNTQKAIDQIGPMLQAALASEDTQYGNTTGSYNASENEQQDQHDQNSTSNQQNYDSSYMAAIRSGIKGLHGLFALLRGTGADGGTADQSVKDLVGSTTSNDIQTGAATRDENQAGLDQSLGSFLTDLKQKRQVAADTHANNAMAIHHDSDTGLQDLYSKMAGFYSDAGDTGGATDWLNRAGDLTPTIAGESNKQVSSYDNSPVVIHAPNLTAFSAPTQPSVVTQPDSGQVGSGIFTIAPPSKKQPQAAPAGA